MRSSLALCSALIACLFCLSAQAAEPANPHAGSAMPANPHAGGMPAGAMPASPHAGGMQAPTEQGLSGKASIKSVYDVPQFTYVEADQAGKSIWLAAPTTKLKKGDKIKYEGGMLMTNFYSKTLKRNFASVIFVSKVTKE